MEKPPLAIEAEAGVEHDPYALIEKALAVLGIRRGEGQSDDALIVEIARRLSEIGSEQAESGVTHTGQLGGITFKEYDCLVSKAHEITERTVPVEASEEDKKIAREKRLNDLILRIAGYFGIETDVPSFDLLRTGVLDRYLKGADSDTLAELGLTSDDEKFLKDERLRLQGEHGGMRDVKRETGY